MARRSSYETYKEYYFQYTKGGRKAAKMLTPSQFERVKKDYAGTGQNVSRRIASDAMELSNKQMRSAARLSRALENAEAVAAAAKSAEFGTTPKIGKKQISEYKTAQKQTITEEKNAIEKAKKTLQSPSATAAARAAAEQRIKDAQQRLDAANKAIESLKNLQDITSKKGEKSTIDYETARKMGRDDFKQTIERLRELGYSHSGISALLGSPEETPV